MSYEPRGKMIDLMAAFRAEPQRVFRGPEVAAMLGCKNYPSSINQYIFAAVAGGIAFKRQVESGWYYAGSPVSDELLLKAGISVQVRPGNGKQVASQSTPEQIEAARADPRAPKFGEPWTPPKMTPPRAGNEAPRAEAQAPAGPAPITAAAPAPPAAPAPQPEAAAAEEDVPQEPFYARVDIDGDLELFGLVELEGGGFRIAAADVHRLRDMIAWMPLRSPA